MKSAIYDYDTRGKQEKWENPINSIREYVDVVLK